MMAVWKLALRESFTEKETLKLSISGFETAGRNKHKQTNFSKASVLKTSWLWPLSKEANTLAE